MRTSHNNKPWETWLVERGGVELFTGGWVSRYWVPKRDDAGWSKKLYAKVQRPEKRASSWDEELNSLSEGEWAVAESQRGMTQDEVKIVCQGATLWKTGIFLRGRVELFTGGWVSCCWVPKRDDVENEKSNYKTDERNRKGKYKQFVWCNLMYKKVFSFSCKGSCKHLIMGRVPCSNEFFIKRLISRKKTKKKTEKKRKERKKERSYFLY